MPQKGSTCEGVLKAIRSIIRAADLQSKTLDLSCGLTGPQLLIMRELENNGVTTTSKLAKNISISQSTATIIIDRLVKKQLVERSRDTVDKRNWFISLTEHGVKVVKDAPPLLQSAFIEQFNSMPEWEQHHTLAVLQRVVAMLNAQSMSNDSAPIITNGVDLLSQYASV